METKIVLPVEEVGTKAWPETNFLLSVLKNFPFDIINMLYYF